MKDWIIFGIVVVVLLAVWIKIYKQRKELKQLRKEKRMNDYFNSQHRT
jgi:heme exporter protein D